jgi:hypothetical protein
MSQSSIDTLLAALRAGDEAAFLSLAHDGNPDEAARRATLRAEVTQELAAQIVSTDRSLARWLLEQEVAYLCAIGHGVTETLYTLVAALARFGQPDDTLTIWRAREATPETQSGVDVEQLLRAGFEPVRSHLHRLASGESPEAQEARAALDWIEAGVADGAADDLPAYFYWADERFGLQVSGPTCRFNGSASCEAALAG